jgi:CopC domain
VSGSATATVASPNSKTDSAASLRMGTCKHVIARNCWGNTGRDGEFPSRLLDAAECLMWCKPIVLEPATSDPADKATLIVKFAQPLQAGSRKVNWQAVSADTHKVKGSFTFQVRP